MGIIVAIEGLPGSGKTTLRRDLMKRLKKKNISCAFADIDNVENVKGVRRIADKLPHSHISRLLLFWSIRILQHETAVSLSKNFDVIFMDRSWATAVVFDGYGNKVPMSIISWIEQFVPKKNGITFFLNTSFMIAKKRKKAKTLNNRNFAKRVEIGYKKIAKERKWLYVDASQKPEKVADHCLSLVIKLLNCPIRNTPP